MKFYFFNTYHQSLMGYQLTWIATGETVLTLAQSNKCDTPELQSALFNSGAQCVIGKAERNKNYFLLRKNVIADREGRTWYINMALEAEDSEAVQFRSLICHILLDYETFRETLGDCFYAQQEEQSYGLDAERFWTYVQGTAEPLVAGDSFYDRSNSYVAELLNSLTAMETITASKLALLVPESTLNYFLNQNVIFRNRRILHNIPGKAFRYLLDKDPAMYSLEDERPVNESKAQHLLTEEQQAVVKKIAAGITAALVVYGTYKLVDYLFGKEK